MKYQLLSVDLDDTLLNDQLEITSINNEAIIYAHSKGVEVVFCTGRPTNSVKKYLGEIINYNHQGYFIAFNGAVVSSIKGDIIFRKTINNELLTKLVEIGRNEDIDIQLYSDERVFVERRSERTDAYEKLSGMSIDLIDDLSCLEMTLKVLYNSTDIEKLERIKNVIEESLSEELNVFFSKKHYLEVLNSEANKGIALAYLANHLNIKKEQVIAIGDSENDSYMISYAGLGISMKNGRDSVKSIAQYVTQKTNNEDGVAEVIYKFIQ